MIRHELVARIVEAYDRGAPRSARARDESRRRSGASVAAAHRYSDRNRRCGTRSRWRQTNRARCNCRGSSRTLNSGRRSEYRAHRRSTIAKLNRDWRGIDKPTNVLSFPASGQRQRSVHLFGDIVIAYETLKRECDDENRVSFITSPISRSMVFFTSSVTITKPIAKPRRWKGSKARS